MIDVLSDGVKTQGHIRHQLFYTINQSLSLMSWLYLSFLTVSNDTAVLNHIFSLWTLPASAPLPQRRGDIANERTCFAHLGEFLLVHWWRACTGACTVRTATEVTVKEANQECFGRQQKGTPCHRHQPFFGRNYKSYVFSVSVAYGARADAKDKVCQSLILPCLLVSNNASWNCGCGWK